MKDDGSGAFDWMMGIVQLIYDQTCPVKFLNSVKDEPKNPCIATEILEASALRHELYVDYLNSECAERLKEFKIICNKVKSIRRKDKKEYFTKQLSLNKDNTTVTWKVINDLRGEKKELLRKKKEEILGKRKKEYWEEEAPPNSLLIQAETVNDETIIINRFAEFFFK